MPSQGISVPDTQPDDFEQAVATQQKYGHFVKDNIHNTGRIINPSKQAIDGLKTAIFSGLQGIMAASKLPEDAPPIMATVAGAAAGLQMPQILAEQRAKAMEIMTPEQLSPRLAAAFPDLAHIPWNISKPLIEIRMKDQNDIIDTQEAILITQYMKNKDPNSDIQPLSLIGQSRKVVMPMITGATQTSLTTARINAASALQEARIKVDKLKDELPLSPETADAFYIATGRRPSDMGQAKLLLQLRSIDETTELRLATALSNIFMPPEIKKELKEKVMEKEKVQEERKTEVELKKTNKKKIDKISAW